jgi:hypothetical protein
MFSGIAGLLREFGLTGLSGICATIQAMLVSGALYHRLRNLNYERFNPVYKPTEKGQQVCTQEHRIAGIQQTPEIA